MSAVSGGEASVGELQREVARLRAELAAARSGTDAVLREAVDALPDGFAVLDRAWRYVALNGPGAAALRRRSEEVVGQVIWDVSPELVGTPFEVAARRAEAEGMSTRADLFDPTLDRWFDVRFFPTPSGMAVLRLDATERRRTEAALGAREERYRAYIEQTTEAVWRFELDEPLDTHTAPDEQVAHVFRHAQLAECNDAMARQYGFSRAEELVGARLTELMDIGDPANAAYLRAFVEAGYRLSDAESHELDRDGAERWFVNNLIGIVENGRLLRAWGTQRDVTAARLGEMTLRASEAEARSVIDAPMIGIGFWEAGVGITRVNNALLSIVGCSREEYDSGRVDWAALTPPEYFASDEKAMAQIEAMGHCTPYEKEYRRRDGTRVPVMIGGSRLEGQSERGAFFVLDMSDRRRAEDALRDSEQRLRLAVSGAGLLVFRYDRDLRYTWAYNPHPDFTPADLLGKRDEDVLPPERAAYLAELKHRVIASARPAHGEIAVELSDGEHVYELTIEPTFDDAGEVDGVMTLGREVTALRRSERERSQLLAAERDARRLAEAAEQRAGFLAEASRVLASSLDYDATLASVAALIVRGIADWCAVDVADGEVLRRVAVAHVDPEKIRLARELGERYPEDPRADRGAYAVFRSGRSAMLERITDELLVTGARDEEHLRLMRALELRSYMAVPLVARGRTLGVITLVMAESGREFAAADLLLAEELGRRAGTAVDNASLYREARAAVARSEETVALLDSVFAGASVGLAFHDRNLRFVRINEALARLHGAPVDAHLGRTLRDVVPDVHDEIETRLRTVLTTGVPMINVELIGPSPEHQRHLLASLFPVRGPTGEVEYVGAAVADVTDHKRAEQALRQAQKLESIGVLAGGIAHDFNNLLTGILGNASLALDAVGLESPARPLLGDAIRATERAADLTRQLLAYAGKGRFFVQQVDLRELVRELATLVNSSVPKKVAVALDLGQSVPAVQADASQLQQLVMNLIINAAEAIGDRPGTVSVLVGTCTLDDATLAGRFPGFEVAAGEFVSLEVRDDGEGMDERTLSMMFDPFFTTKFTGRGLGLAAALGIVRGHHGAIAVESAVGRGTTFTVVLPAAGVARSEAAPPEVVAGRGHETVLVVDDEGLVRRLARAALEDRGYTVVEAAHGAEALACLRDAPGIAAVVLDMTMPVMAGEEAAAALKAVSPDVRIVVTSGYGETEALRRLGTTVVSAFLQKPFTASQLADRVRLALDAPA